VQRALPIVFPGQQTGGIAIDLSNEFNTLEMLWRQSATMPSGRQVDFLAGYRYCHFGENLSIDSKSTYTVGVPPIPIGTIQLVNDRFLTVNDFQGGEVGISTKTRYGRWSAELLGKMALGNTRSLVNISGLTTLSGNATPTIGGLLALPSNSGVFTENDFTVIPELGLTIGYDLTERLKATCGYTFLYWSRVARPCDQVDLNINPAGNSVPTFRYVPGDYWVQGFTFGLDYRF
jgi:hypothetical protein